MAFVRVVQDVLEQNHFYIKAKNQIETEVTQENIKYIEKYHEHLEQREQSPCPRRFRLFKIVHRKRKEMNTYGKTQIN